MSKVTELEAAILEKFRQEILVLQTDIRDKQVQIQGFEGVVARMIRDAADRCGMNSSEGITYNPQDQTLEYQPPIHTPKPKLESEVSEPI